MTGLLVFRNVIGRPMIWPGPRFTRQGLFISMHWKALPRAMGLGTAGREAFEADRSR